MGNDEYPWIPRIEGHGSLTGWAKDPAASNPLAQPEITPRQAAETVAGFAQSLSVLAALTVAEALTQLADAITTDPGGQFITRRELAAHLRATARHYESEATR